VSDRNVTVSVSVRGLIMIGLAIALGWALMSIAGALMVILTAVFATLVLDPPVSRLAARTGWSRGRSAMLIVSGVVVGGLLITLALVIPLLRSLRDLIHDLPNIVADIRASDAFKWLDERIDFGADLQKHAADIAAKVPDTISAFVGLAGNTFSFFLVLTELIFLTLFLLSDLPELTGATGSVLYPESADRFDRLRTQITTTFSRYAIGAVLIASIAGTLMGTTAWLLGTPYALALGLIAGLLDLIPQIGATIAGVILTLVTLPQGIPQAVVMVIVVLVYQQVENYILQPAIQGRAAHISGFFVIASVVVFGSLLGVIGALVAVPVTAGVQIVLRELTADRRARVAEAKAAAMPQPAG
jgi:predicted PurR-regulated permease PerM